MSIYVGEGLLPSNEEERRFEHSLLFVNSTLLFEILRFFSTF